MLTHKGTPAEQHVPAKWVDKILHARLDIGDQVLMASDTPPDRYEKPAGFSVSRSRLAHVARSAAGVEWPILRCEARGQTAHR